VKGEGRKMEGVEGLLKGLRLSEEEREGVKIGGGPLRVEGREEEV
jgi:hypothetical protein